MASADPQRQQHAQGRRRASFILRGRPRGPGARAAGQARAHPRPDRTRGPRREQSERAGERAEPGCELEVSGGRPRLSRAAFSNSARWALRRQRGRGAFSLTLGGPGPRRRQWLQSWGSGGAGGGGAACPESQTSRLRPRARTLEPSQPSPFRVRKRSWDPRSMPGNFARAILIPTTLPSVLDATIPIF